MKKYTVFLCALILLAPLTANAAPITFDFTATAYNSWGIWGGLNGSLIGGSYTYDTALVDAGPANPANDTFYSFFPAANQAFLWDLTVTAGGVTRSTSNNQNAPGTNHHLLSLVDVTAPACCVDQYWFNANQVASTDDLGRIILQDTSRTAYGGLPSTVPTTAPDLTDFNQQSNYYHAYNNSGAQEGRIWFTITSITPAAAPVPEPATMLLLGSGLIGLAVVGRKKFSKK